MKTDAKKHEEEDKKIKESIDIHNQADQLIYQTEKQLDEFKDKLDESTINNLKNANDSLIEANKGDDLEKIRLCVDELNKIWASATESMYKESSQNSNDTPEDQDSESKDNSEIKDADFEVVDDDK